MNEDNSKKLATALLSLAMASSTGALTSMAFADSHESGSSKSKANDAHKCNSCKGQGKSKTKEAHKCNSCKGESKAKTKEAHTCKGMNTQTTSDDEAKKAASKKKAEDAKTKKAKNAEGGSCGGAHGCGA